MLGDKIRVAMSDDDMEARTIFIVDCVSGSVLVTNENCVPTLPVRTQYEGEENKTYHKIMRKQFKTDLEKDVTLPKLFWFWFDDGISSGEIDFQGSTDWQTNKMAIAFDISLTSAYKWGTPCLYEFKEVEKFPKRTTKCEAEEWQSYAYKVLKVLFANNLRLCPSKDVEDGVESDTEKKKILVLCANDDLTVKEKKYKTILGKIIDNVDVEVDFVGEQLTKSVLLEPHERIYDSNIFRSKECLQEIVDKGPYDYIVEESFTKTMPNHVTTDELKKICAVAGTPLKAATLLVLNGINGNLSNANFEESGFKNVDSTTSNIPPTANSSETASNSEFRKYTHWQLKLLYVNLSRGNMPSLQSPECELSVILAMMQKKAVVPASGGGTVNELELETVKGILRDNELPVGLQLCDMGGNLTIFNNLTDKPLELPQSYNDVLGCYSAHLPDNTTVKLTSDVIEYIFNEEQVERPQMAVVPCGTSDEINLNLWRRTKETNSTQAVTQWFSKYASQKPTEHRTKLLGDLLLKLSERLCRLGKESEFSQEFRVVSFEDYKRVANSVIVNIFSQVN